MHLFQVGAGSGGIAVLDLIARDSRVTHVTLVEPDIYAIHNVYRHFFPPASVGRLKAELAAEWIQAIRPDIAVTLLIADITDPNKHAEFTRLAAECDFGICAADNETAKFAFDALMRNANKPWTLGEVLSGGIGGWVHRFIPGEACYGCVASYLQREVTEHPASPPPDYSNPNATQPETTIPASKASIAVIAGLHATVTLDLLTDVKQAHTQEAGARKQRTEDGDQRTEINPGSNAPNSDLCPPSPNSRFTSLLFSLEVVPGVFDLAYRSHRLQIPRSPTCLVCGTPAPIPTGEQLDAAVDDALARLGVR